MSGKRSTSGKLACDTMHHCMWNIYCLNIHYSVDLGSTLEFLQRCLFMINPERGTKVETKNKNKLLVNPRVLIGDLADQDVKDGPIQLNLIVTHVHSLFWFPRACFAMPWLDSLFSLPACSPRCRLEIKQHSQHSDPLRTIKFLVNLDSALDSPPTSLANKFFYYWFYFPVRLQPEPVIV
ncbi:uncharacterized protein PAE49_014614 isoform 1-T1 [Odontesthes bonariensis]